MGRPLNSDDERQPYREVLSTLSEEVYKLEEGAAKEAAHPDCWGVRLKKMEGRKQVLIDVIGPGVVPKTEAAIVVKRQSDATMYQIVDGVDGEPWLVRAPLELAPESQEGHSRTDEKTTWGELEEVTDPNEIFELRELIREAKTIAYLEKAEYN